MQPATVKTETFFCIRKFATEINRTFISKIFQMEEPIPKKFLTSNNSRSLDSTLSGGQRSNQQQPSEMEKLRRQLVLARGENLTLQKELSAAMKEDEDNREKISELTRKLREIEKKQEQNKPMKTKKDNKIDDVTTLEQKVRSLEVKNRALEDKLKRLEEDKDINKEKQDIIEMQKAKINELEEMLRGKEKSSYVFDKIGDASVNKKEIEFQKVMNEYDTFLRKILAERQTLIEEKNTAQKHLANLETAFNDLLQKYERAKKVVEGFKNNEEILKKQIQDWNKMLNIFNKKYNDLKAYAEKKISEANTAILKSDKGNIEEMAKLKAKILQSQVKINDLEKHIKPNELDNVSLFAPLKNNLRKKH
ncbi:transforming acidic coiled-coil-containing protein 3-like [Coccinella septempunctata]|uniref:transforming acidic coiled-coil-containing protein 3-like n=1 Tax=Coccinella septempunctata TaxID=41139 RepID=UPI001D072BCC|nr:transforming acidic coiled-coil-containing protein 3-like [Coccinella septempunctata]